MQDYDGPPYRPLIGEGAWPDRYVNLVFLLLLLAAVVVCALAYRTGRNAAVREAGDRRSLAPRIIFKEIRQKIDVALMATGVGVINPANALVATIDLYLGALVAFSSGFGGPYHALRKALTTTSVEEDHHAHGAGHGGHGEGASPAPLYFIGPGVGAGNATASANAGLAGGASAATNGGSIHMVQPLQPVYPVSTEGGQKGDHGPAKVEKRKRDLTAKEQARAVRDALEALAEYWQKDRVESQLLAIQESLLITRPIGDKPPVPARPRPTGAAPAPARAANAGRFPWLKL
jgi:hypothetical protein